MIIMIQLTILLRKFGKLYKTSMIPRRLVQRSMLLVDFSLPNGRWKISGGSGTRLLDDCGRIEIQRYRDWRQFGGS